MRKVIVLFLILLSATCFGATRQKTWSTGDTITANDLNSDWDNFYSEKITSTNIADGAVGNNQLGTITASNKINLSSIYVGGQSQGDIIYYNGSAWARLGAGTSGQFLKTQGAGANPAWDTVGIGLGAWDAGAPWVVNTSYQAATDGFVVGYTSGSQQEILTDSFNPPTTRRHGAGSDTTSGGLCCPVRKGDYWKVTGGTIYWIPMN